MNAHRKKQTLHSSSPVINILGKHRSTTNKVAKDPATNEWRGEQTVQDGVLATIAPGRFLRGKGLDKKAGVRQQPPF